MIVEILQGIISTLWLMLPIYIPNPAAVLFRGKLPMDFGKKFIDGRRILGRGKTWRGFFGGALSGFAFGLIQNGISFYLPGKWFPYFSRSWILAAGLLLTMSFGSMLGDLTGSFIKRRLGIESGSKAFLLDQLTFVVVAWLILYSLFSAWFVEHFWNVLSLATVFILTPIIHRAVNILGYKLKLKEVPW